MRHVRVVSAIEFFDHIFNDRVGFWFLIERTLGQRGYKGGTSECENTDIHPYSWETAVKKLFAIDWYIRRYMFTVYSSKSFIYVSTYRGCTLARASC